MELQVQVEKPSKILRKLTVKVSAKTVANRFERGLAEVQRTANLKGFRPGHAPMSVIKQYYGEDVRHRLYHNLIDESFQEAIREQKIMTVGRPTIETPDHKTGEGEHDHAAQEDRDFTYVATVEVMPEIEVKGYTGIALTKEKAEVKKEDVQKVIDGLLDMQAQIIPAAGGLVGADGKTSSRPVKKGDYADIAFSGGLVTETGVEEKPGMKGSRLLEVGSDSLIPGFEENLIGMRAGETKTFRIAFPKDFYEAEFQGKESEFTVTVNELKEKKVPELNDDFAKQAGYENVADMRKKAEEHLVTQKNEESDRKLRNDLVTALIAKNEFECPKSLIEAQTRSLAQEWAEELKRQGVNEQAIQQAIVQELDNLRKRGENQVRASLILEAIAKKEGIETKDGDFETEVKRLSESMNIELAKLQEFYGKNPGRRDDMLFRLRQEMTLKFLLEKSKIK